jgi:hypothetical protein
MFSNYGFDIRYGEVAGWDDAEAPARVATLGVVVAELSTHHSAVDGLKIARSVFLSPS